MLLYPYSGGHVRRLIRERADKLHVWFGGATANHQAAVLIQAFLLTTAALLRQSAHIVHPPV